jgi:hypothetical protein
MASENATNDGLALEMRRLDLEQYKAKLDFRKFVLGSVFAAITIAAIPPLFQLATAYLEYIKSEAARATQAQQFRDGYVKDFLNTALNQDIEVRIRFARYFSSVSSDKEGWAKYRDDLTTLRNEMKAEIDKLELAWQKLADQQGSDPYEVARLRRHLDWAYSEVGYAAPNRSAITNPRGPDEARQPGVITLDSVRADRRDIAQKILDAFAAAGFGQVQQVAALANAIAESGLDPSAKATLSSATGLFQLLTSSTGKTREELLDPDTNIAVIIEFAKKTPSFAAATTLDDAVSAFVRYIFRYPNANAETIKRQQIARRLVRT